MARSVLLVEPDVEALGEMASKLRSLGLSVSLADGDTDLAGRLRSARADAILLSDRLSGLPEALRRLDSEPDLAQVPRLLLAADAGIPADGIEALPRTDLELVAKRLYAMQSRPPPTAVFRDDFRGDLQQVSVLDLLQLLSMNRRTGSLSLTTPNGAGEVRLRDGEVVDALFRRLEAEKALYRLLDEREGGFAFTSGGTSVPPRIQTPTRALLMDGLRQLDEVRRWREDLKADEDVLVTDSFCTDEDDADTQRIMEALAVPRSLDELLDDLTIPDHRILEQVLDLIKSGRVRRIPKGAARVQVASAEQLTVLGAVANRLRRDGFSGPPRLVLAVPPRKIHTFAHTLQRLADAVAPPDGSPSVPVAHLLATLRLGEASELAVIGLPLALEHSALWPLVLPGSAAVVEVEPDATGSLADACLLAGVPVFQGVDLVGPIDEARPAIVASLIRRTLEALAGEK